MVVQLKSKIQERSELSNNKKSCLCRQAGNLFFELYLVMCYHKKQIKIIINEESKNYFKRKRDT